MNFPLICMENKINDFSEMISYCYQEYIQYLDLENERNLYL